MSEQSFERAAVIGTGMMGPGIAVTLTLGGVAATLLSRTDESARQGLQTAHAQLALLEENGLATAEQAVWSRAHLAASADRDAVLAGVDLVIESAPENMAFKQDLFADLEARVPGHAVLTSNTSGLSITAIASQCQRPERIVTTHFWNPPHLMPLVEVVKGEKTDHAVAVAVRDLLARCGKVPVIVKKDTPGQLGNRLQHALIREAIHIVQEGIADVEEVDLAAKAGFGLRLPVYGIFEHQDAVGLDMTSAILDYVSRDLSNERGTPAYMRQLVEAGHLGAKTGRGFYDWSDKSIDAVKARRDQFVLEFLRRYRRVPAAASAADSTP